jgi:mRNA-degrading endonuclease RelE of RelBE toxin-antitoxin system
MPPDILYGISKDPDVLDFVRGQPASLRDKINDAIDSLQANPRPQGHIPAIFSGFPIIKLVISTTQPPYLLVYTVDDNKEKIYVIAVQEKRFSN